MREMASLPPQRPATFFPTRRPRRRLPPPPSFAPTRIHELPHLHLSLAKIPALGFSVSSAKRDDDVFDPAGSPPLDLEAEIYEFMERSANPQGFPSKQELLAAGRGDLVEAIIKQGGWLTFGWDLDDGCEGSPQEDFRIWQQRLTPSNEGHVVDDSASTSGRSREMEGGEGVGVEGILSRLKKERRLSYSSGLREKGLNGRGSRCDEHDAGDIGVNAFESSTPDMWRKWSHQRAGFPASEFEAAEIVHNEGRKQLEEQLEPDIPIDVEKPKVAHNLMETADGMSVPHSHAKESSNQIHMRLQHVESKLNSALNSLRCRTNGAISHKCQTGSAKELYRLSDALEFQETEIMNARDKLRSTRAKLAVLEGKMALQTIEAQKLMVENQRRLDAAQNASLLLHTIYITWPNSASEVLLVGSFDGWTTQRKMERSSAGIFSLCLKLYPGRYEMKFIVDGVWTVDPLRPIVHNGGHENNLLVIT